MNACTLKLRNMLRSRCCRTWTILLQACPDSIKEVIAGTGHDWPLWLQLVMPLVVETGGQTLRHGTAAVIPTSHAHKYSILKGQLPKVVSECAFPSGLPAMILIKSIHIVSCQHSAVLYHRVQIEGKEDAPYTIMNNKISDISESNILSADMTKAELQFQRQSLLYITRHLQHLCSTCLGRAWVVYQSWPSISSTGYRL